MMKNKKSASALISDLKRKTRKAYNSEDKIRIIIEGMVVMADYPLLYSLINLSW